MLTKITVETVLNVELDEHLGFTKHKQSDTGNSCNSYSLKTLQTEAGQFELGNPAQPGRSFVPQLGKSISGTSHGWTTRSSFCKPRE